jgi:uncharacterized protein (DUF1501 family)
MIDRRHLLASLTAASALSGAPRIAFAAGQTDRRLVIVLLRGAMDGLSAAPAFGDPDYERARNGLATPRPGQAGGALDLDGHFGLHPSLTGLHARYAAKELVVFHAIASPYRDRSHFDGQNLLENGSPTPYGLADGWLNRALLGLPDNARAGRSNLGVALAPAMPLMLRGSAPVTSWSPSILPGPGPDFLARVKALYDKTDPKLAAALSGAVDANTATAGMSGQPDQAFAALMSAAARFLSEPDGPCAAMVESTGWDTHANQSQGHGAKVVADRGAGDDRVRPHGGDEWHRRHRSRHGGRGVPVGRFGGGRPGAGGLAGTEARRSLRRA